jgi:hypothetical protein
MRAIAEEMNRPYLCKEIELGSRNGIPVRLKGSWHVLQVGCPIIVAVEPISIRKTPAVVHCLQKESNLRPIAFVGRLVAALSGSRLGRHLDVAQRVAMHEVPCFVRGHGCGRLLAIPWFFTPRAIGPSLGQPHALRRELLSRLKQRKRPVPPRRTTASPQRWQTGLTPQRARSFPGACR